MLELFQRKFVILTSARTGSNALVNALTGHPEIHCDYEVFHPLQIYTAGDSPFAIAERDADPVGFLDRVMEWNSGRFPEKHVYGFKLFFAHSRAVFDRVIADPSWAKIVLYRQNLLDQFTSEQIARASSKWNSDHGNAGSQKIQVKISQLEYFLRHSQARFDEARTILKTSGQVHLELEYQDVAQGRFDAVCDFLKVDGSVPVATRLEKQNSPLSADRISNVDEVKSWLIANDHMDWWVD